jgi:aspartate racemase
MKLIGMIGGLSWESTAQYYRIINETVRSHLGPLHSAPCLLFSLNFAEIAQLQHAGDWIGASRVMIDAAESLYRGGARFLVICSNTMHRVADEIEQEVSIPLLHIADATAERVRAAGIARVGLLGTAFTMEQPFYKDRLIQQHGISVITPPASERQLLHRIIYEELVQGRVEAKSRRACVEVIESLVSRGAEGIVLGCTELMLLEPGSLTAAPLFDTATIHAEAAVEMALEAGDVSSTEVRFFE